MERTRRMKRDSDEIDCHSQVNRDSLFIDMDHFPFSGDTNAAK